MRDLPRSLWRVVSLAASENKGKTSFLEDISGNREIRPPENTTKEVNTRRGSLVGNLPSRDKIGCNIYVASYCDRLRHTGV